MNMQTLLAGIGLLACALFPKPALGAKQQDEGFPDVPKTHWAYEAVTDLKRRGILVGYPPEAPRAAAAKRPNSARRPVQKLPIHRRSRK